MPTYEYRCKICDKTFEKFQNVNDEALKNCIYCNGEVVRIFHPVGVIFKGSGFYSTDNKKKERKTEKAPSKKAEKQEKTACSKQDSCPAANTCS